MRAVLVLLFTMLSAVASAQSVTRAEAPQVSSSADRMNSASCAAARRSPTGTRRPSIASYAWSSRKTLAAISTSA